MSPLVAEVEIPNHPGWCTSDDVEPCAIVHEAPPIHAHSQRYEVLFTFRTQQGEDPAARSSKGGFGAPDICLTIDNRAFEDTSIEVGMSLDEAIAVRSALDEAIRDLQLVYWCAANGHPTEWALGWKPNGD
ncbi:MAG TPA: hypothetical protein VHV79_03160 [Mycobacteriales bacterium]|nr:hypothetical protein [Mycobacteriales bacterium]